MRFSSLLGALFLLIALGWWRGREAPAAALGEPTSAEPNSTSYRAAA